MSSDWDIVTQENRVNQFILEGTTLYTREGTWKTGPEVYLLCQSEDDCQNVETGLKNKRFKVGQNARL